MQTDGIFFSRLFMMFRLSVEWNEVVTVAKRNPQRKLVSKPWKKLRAQQLRALKTQWTKDSVCRCCNSPFEGATQQLFSTSKRRHGILPKKEGGENNHVTHDLENLLEINVCVLMWKKKELKRSSSSHSLSGCKHTAALCGQIKASAQVEEGLESGGRFAGAYSVYGGRACHVHGNRLRLFLDQELTRP